MGDPQVALENSVENLQKLLEALNGASQHAERDFDKLESKPDDDEVLNDLVEKVNSIQEATRLKFVEQLPKDTGDVATELGQLEIAAKGAHQLMENLEKSLEAADLDLVNAVAQAQTQLQEAQSTSSLSQTNLTEHLELAVTTATEAHQEADHVHERLKQLGDDLRDETVKLFEQAREAVEHAIQTVDQTLHASVDTSLKTIMAALEGPIKTGLDQAIETFDERATVDVSWVVQASTHIEAAVGGVYSNINTFARHCSEKLATELQQEFDKAVDLAGSQLVGELAEVVQLVSLALVALESLRPLLPELSVAEKTLEEFNAVLEQMSTGP
ncbi:MAG: hypothetical protein ACR2IE_07115 [Candidatus Sumerlaeaceae bacterium]